MSNPVNVRGQRTRYQMRVIACLLDAGGHRLPDGFVNARLRRRLGMRGRGLVMVENQENQ